MPQHNHDDFFFFLNICHANADKKKLTSYGLTNTYVQSLSEVWNMLSRQWGPMHHPSWETYLHVWSFNRFIIINHKEIIWSGNIIAVWWLTDEQETIQCLFLFLFLFFPPFFWVSIKLLSIACFRPTLLFQSLALRLFIHSHARD